jgi:hypothetical protein
MRSRACGGPVRNGARDGPLLGQQVLRQAVTGSAALHGATTLTCVDWVRRGGITVAFPAVKGLQCGLASRPSGVQIPEPPPLTSYYAAEAQWLVSSQ